MALAMTSHRLLEYLVIVRVLHYSPRLAFVSLLSASAEMTAHVQNKVTCKQDMTEEGFFEGTEKLLEVWFSSSSSDGKSEEASDAVGEGKITGPDLRRIDRSLWEDLLKLVHCEIISMKSDKDMDAYVLSESSMFVSKNRFILKTCGRTSLLHAMEPLLSLVHSECDMDRIDDLFYSRKKYTRPELQPAVHQDFNTEMNHLDALFDNGAAYALGRMNADCWYLYTIDNIGVLQPDQTLEVLMQDLDPDVMDIFSVKHSHSADEAGRMSGVSQLMPDMIIDHFLFDPHGYSMNGILPNGQYVTIHITPEPHCSYVSFETNVAKESYRELIMKVVNLFKPGKFLLTVFANKASLAKDFYKELSRLDCFSSYRRCDHEYCQFKNYNLTFTSYMRPPALPPR